MPLIIIKTENAVESVSKIEYINSTIIIINNNILEWINQQKLELEDKQRQLVQKNLDKKQNIFGISGQLKKWTLLSSHYDKFLIRNISEKVGLKFTPKCEHFDAIFNGNFRDNYFVCD